MCRSKRVDALMNGGIINSIRRLLLVGYLSWDDTRVAPSHFDVVHRVVCWQVSRHIRYLRKLTFWRERNSPLSYVQKYIVEIHLQTYILTCILTYIFTHIHTHTCHFVCTGWSKSLCAPHDYSTNHQVYRTFWSSCTCKLLYLSTCQPTHLSKYLTKLNLVSNFFF
jgi:hypothetical protein